MLREIERYTGQRLTPAKVPTQADVAARRLALFKARILKTLHEEDLQVYLALVEDLAQESNRDMAEIAAAAARLARGTTPLVVPLEPEREGTPPTEPGMVRLFLDAGRRSGVRPADIVGALANEGGVPGQLIGAVDIYDDFTFVEIPNSYQERVLTGLSGVTIRNRKATLRPATAQDVAPPRARKRGDSGAARRQSLGPSQKKRGLQHGKRVGRAGAPRHAAAKTR
jgi:ATP-dependent RNA helicase DeaD